MKQVNSSGYISCWTVIVSQARHVEATTSRAEILEEGTLPVLCPLSQLARSTKNAFTHLVYIQHHSFS